MPSQIDGIFFRGDKTCGFALLPHRQQFTDVGLRIGMMVTVNGLGNRLDPGCPELSKEVLRPCNPTERNCAFRNLLRLDAAAYTPQMLTAHGKSIFRGTVH